MNVKISYTHNYIEQNNEPSEHPNDSGRIGSTQNDQSTLIDPSQFTLLRDSSDSLPVVKWDQYGICDSIQMLLETYLLFNLKTVNDRRKLTKDIIRSLVIFQLCGNQIGKISQRLGCIENLSIITEP